MRERTQAACAQPPCARCHCARAAARQHDVRGLEVERRTPDVTSCRCRLNGTTERGPRRRRRAWSSGEAEAEARVERRPRTRRSAAEEAEAVEERGRAEAEQRGREDAEPADSVAMMPNECGLPTSEGSAAMPTSSESPPLGSPSKWLRTKGVGAREGQAESRQRGCRRVCRCVAPARASADLRRRDRRFDA